MYAMLGDVRFEVLNSFTSLETDHAAAFAKHDVLQGRPRLQAMGNENSVKLPNQNSVKSRVFSHLI